MKALLINSHISEDTTSASEDALPPLGYGYISCELKKAGVEVDLLDAYHLNLNSTSVISIIGNNSYDYHLINIFSSNFSNVINIINKTDEDKKWLIGGTPAKFLSNEIRKHTTGHNVHVVIGEAEHYIPEALLSGINRGFSMYTIDKSNTYFPHDLHTAPDRTIYDNNFKQYCNGSIIEAAIITSRGCPFDCSFCCAARSINPDTLVRKVPREIVSIDIDALNSLGKEYNCIRVLDDLFIKNEKTIEDAEYLFKRNNKHWRSMAHIDILSNFNSSSLGKLRNSGCLELFIGIESGSDKTLKSINKKSNTQQITNTIMKVLESGINVKGYFILGFPNETLNDAQETERMIRSLFEFSLSTPGKFRPSIFKFRPYHGTALYDDIVRSGHEVNDITTDSELTKTGRRDSYDLTSGNYSCIESEVLNKLIDGIRNDTRDQKESDRGFAM